MLLFRSFIGFMNIARIKILLIVLLPFLVIFPLLGKIRILTFHYNKPELIDLQNQALRTFMKDDYELIIFNDGPTQESEKAIRNACAKSGITCIRYEQKWHLLDPQNAKILNWFYKRTNAAIYDWKL